MTLYPCNFINLIYIFYYVNYSVYYRFQIKWKNVVPSLMEIVVLQLPPEGVEKSIECVQTEPHRDIDEQAISGQNSNDDFVNPPPPSMKVIGKRKKGQSVSPAKRVRKKGLKYHRSNGTD